MRVLTLFLTLALPAPALASSLKIENGIRESKTNFIAPYQQVVLSGEVANPQGGALEITKAGRTPFYEKLGAGKFSFKFAKAKSGFYKVTLRFGQERITRGIFVMRPLREGSSGNAVRALQKALRKLRFPTAHDGRYGPATARAVMAYRKTNNLPRVWSLDMDMIKQLFRGRGAFKLRYPGAGRHVEFDWSRQVMVLSSGGKVRYTYHISSGAPETPTVFGRYRFYRKDPGTNSLGMVHSSYFIRGYAIHGFASVPTYPASHGCLRVPIPDALFIYNWIKLGDQIFTYR